MDRHWLLTWTTYGTWMPGDERGFVSNVADGAGSEVRHNIPGTPYDVDDARVRERAELRLIDRPVWLTEAQAPTVAEQIRETARFRGWIVHAGAIMRNHLHLVAGVEGAPEPSTLLHDFKSYATRALNKAGHRPSGARWWTESGSKRKLPDERVLHAAIEYVCRQSSPLLI